MFRVVQLPYNLQTNILLKNQDDTRRPLTCRSLSGGLLKDAFLVIVVVLCMSLIYNTLHNCFMARCKRPSFTLQYAAFQRLKGHLSQFERCPFAKCPFFLMISKYYPCLPYLFSKLRRRASFSVLEYAVEVAQVVETAEEADVCYALACVEQQPCRISKAYVYKIFA